MQSRHEHTTEGGWEVVEWLMCLLCKHGDQSSDPRTLCKRLAVWKPAFNRSALRWRQDPWSRLTSQACQMNRHSKHWINKHGGEQLRKTPDANPGLHEHSCAHTYMCTHTCQNVEYILHTQAYYMYTYTFKSMN